MIMYINFYISKFVLFCTNGHCQDFVRKHRTCRFLHSNSKFLEYFYQFKKQFLMFIIYSGCIFFYSDFHFKKSMGEADRCRVYSHCRHLCLYISQQICSAQDYKTKNLTHYILILQGYFLITFCLFIAEIQLPDHFVPFKEVSKLKALENLSLVLKLENKEIKLCFQAMCNPEGCQSEL